MNEPFRVFVNERPVTVSPGADVRVALAAFDPALALQLADGSAYVTDGRGIEMDAATLLAPGAILRVVVSARRGRGEAESDDAGA